MVTSEHKRIIEQCDFFKATQIEVSSIYKNDPLEKCFLVRDVKRSINYKARLFRKEFPTHVDSEYKALTFLKQNAITWVPNIYYSSLEGENSIIVYEFFDGISIDKLGTRLGLDEIKVVKNDLIIQINNLHSITTSGFGDFSGNEFASWKDYFKLKFFNHINNALNLGVITQEEFEIINVAFDDNSSYYDTVKSTFLHFDIKPSNVVYEQPTGNTHIIDFELCRRGDRLMEFVRLITPYNEPDYLHQKLFAPLAQSYFDSFTGSVQESSIYTLYNLYNLLAYYTTSEMNRGIKKHNLIEPIKKDIKALRPK